ncbi:hypothetical protein MRX96_028851 [Rhipicephalus microplus]
MSRIVARWPEVVNIIDYILIFHKDWQEHDESLNAILARLEEKNVTLNKKMCAFWVTSVKFLGAVVGADGISPDLNKFKIVKNVVPSTDCAVWAETRLQRSEPVLPTVAPDRSQHNLVLDLFLLKRAQQGKNYNRRQASSKLTPLRLGDCVWATDTCCSDEVLSQAQRPQSYSVQTPQRCSLA